jgi:AraC-like DNA-binding protein
MKLSRSKIQRVEEIHWLISRSEGRSQNIEDLAVRAKMSKTQLQGSFKLLYGVTIYQFQLRVLMEHAIKLLNSGMLVKEVAQELNYSNAKSFSRAFKMIFNKPPEDYKD